jgi:hypothetical protein
VLLAEFALGREEDVIAAMDARDRHTAWHEAGHAVAAALCGTPTEYAVMGPTPHVLYGPGGERTEEALMTTSLAGRVAAGYAERRVFPPHEEEIMSFITKTKDSMVGSCNKCKVFQLLVIAYSHETDNFDKTAARLLQ